MPRDKYLTTQELADILSVRPKTVRAWIERSEIRAVKLHRQWRVPASEVDRLLKECRRHAG